MAFKHYLPLFLVISSSFAKLEYPEVRRDETVTDSYYGVEVKDPYRWLEDPNSEEVKQFVTAQNEVTRSFVDQPIRSEILKTLTTAFDYTRYKIPEKHGSRYFFYKNTGTQHQDVFYVQDSLNGEPRVFFDPNALSEDGSVSVDQFSFSDNGELVAYGLQHKGSDWVTIHIRNVSTGIDFPEVLEFVKFSNFEWTVDGLGFFYARFPPSVTKGRTDGTQNDKVSNQKIYYHKVSTPQSEDVLVAEFPDHEDWLVGGMTVTREGNYLLVYPTSGAAGEHLVYYANLVEPLRSGEIGKLKLIPVISSFEAEYEYVTNDESIIYFRTNRGAPNYRIVGIDLNKPEEVYWSTLVPESTNNRVLQWAFPVNQDKLVVGYLEDVKSALELRFLGNGSFILNFELGEIGTVNSYSGRRSHDEFFFNFVSFLSPGTCYRVDLTNPEVPPTAKVYRQVQAPGLDPTKFVTKQVFFSSKDGTRVPMFIIHRKDYVPQRNSPTYIYAYGGFNINILPSYSPERVVFVQHFNGVYAIPNIRGGGEYGETWHQGGRLLNKQNSFDDFQAAAEYLIAQNYTVPSKIVINGGSNGGFLIGACVNQRPELYGAGIAQVGVLDLLRFQKFTIGHAWCSEYGCSDDGNKTHFENLYRLSPLHNVRLPQDPVSRVQYPSVLLMTGSHDDRVVPLHSYKLAAELQYTIGRSVRQTNPLLLKVTTSVGHGGGKPTLVKVAEFADIFTFLVQAVGFNPCERLQCAYVEAVRPSAQDTLLNCCIDPKFSTCVKHLIISKFEKKKNRSENKFKKKSFTNDPNSTSTSTSAAVVGVAHTVWVKVLNSSELSAIFLEVF